MTIFGAKLPKKFILLETTKKWDTQIFVIDSVDLDDPQIKRQMDSGTYDRYNKIYSNSYADPYSLTYLFKDKILNYKINKTERLRLKTIALKKKIKKINLVGPNYYTVPNYHKVKKGFFITVSDPVFSSDKKYAFVSFYIYQKEEKKETINQYYFGDVTIVYEKQSDNKWKKIVCKAHNIL